MLKAEDFLAPPVRRIQVVDLPIKGGQAAVRGLFAMEAVRLSDALKEAGTEGQRLLAVQLAAFLSDADGHPLLTLDQAMNAVGNIEPADLKAIIEAGTRLNRLTDDTIEEASKN